MSHDLTEMSIEAEGYGDTSTYNLLTKLINWPPASLNVDNPNKTIKVKKKYIKIYTCVNIKI